MNELSLFTGAGGGIYASLLLGWRTIGYVEYDDYCQRVIAQRINDGIFHEAPIFGDIRQFLQSGAVDEYRGVTDVVSGGFPCQPFSIAGKRAGADDERNMWPATIECIRRVQPRYAFLENVPGILTSGYFGTILGDLAESGYDARWRVLSAAEVGAPHLRNRLWIVAYSENTGQQARRADRVGNAEWAQRLAYCTHSASDVADADQERRNGRAWEQRAGWRAESADGGADVADAISQRCATGAQGRRPIHHENGNGTGEVAGWKNEQQGACGGSETSSCANSIGARLEGQQQAGAKTRATHKPGHGLHSRWWDAEPGVGRVVDGLAHRGDRLRAIGNGQVPLVAYTAWHLLTEGLDA